MVALCKGFGIVTAVRRCAGCWPGGAGSSCPRQGRGRRWVTAACIPASRVPVERLPPPSRLPSAPLCLLSLPPSLLSSSCLSVAPRPAPPLQRGRARAGLKVGSPQPQRVSSVLPALSRETGDQPSSLFPPCSADFLFAASCPWQGPGRAEREVSKPLPLPGVACSCGAPFVAPQRELSLLRGFTAGAGLVGPQGLAGAAGGSSASEAEGPDAVAAAAPWDGAIGGWKVTVALTPGNNRAIKE